MVIELLDIRLQILLQCQYSQGGSQAELKCDSGIDKPVWHCRVQTARITWQLQKQENCCQDPFWVLWVLAQDQPMVTAKHLPMRWSKKVWLSGLHSSGKVLGTMCTYACECVQRQVFLALLALFVHSWWNLKMKHKGKRAEPPVNYCGFFCLFVFYFRR